MAHCEIAKFESPTRVSTRLFSCIIAMYVAGTSLRLNCTSCLACFLYEFLSTFALHHIGRILAVCCDVRKPYSHSSPSELKFSAKCLVRRSHFDPLSVMCTSTHCSSLPNSDAYCLIVRGVGSQRMDADECQEKVLVCLGRVTRRQRAFVCMLLLCALPLLILCEHASCWLYLNLNS